MRLYLIDGNSYVYRAFYAIKSLTNSKGFPTNAIYGFTNMLLKIIREKAPEGLVVSFDSAGPTDRHKLYGEYKAHRPEAPRDLVRQLPFIREIIGALKIPVYEVPGYEADDILGTIAKKAAQDGSEVYIVTGDKDMLQLVDDHIRIYDPMKDKVLDKDYVKEKFGIGPERVTEFMALMGDATDNIPGIKGVGEKTAKNLLRDFGSLDELLDHTERIKKDKLRKMVEENKEIVRLSEKLATIDTDVPLYIDEEAFKVAEPDWQSLFPLFREFEFTTLMKLIPTAEESERERETVRRPGRLREVVLLLGEDFALDTEATGRDPWAEDLVGIALCHEPRKTYYVPVAHRNENAGDQMSREEALDILGPFFADSGKAKIGHNLKYDISLLQKYGIRFSGSLFDTMIAAYLLNPNKTKYGLDEVAFEYLGRRKKSFVEVLKKRRTFADVPVDEAAPYATEDAALSYELKAVLFPKLKETGMEGIYSDIEMPLIEVLCDMEKAGIKIDTDMLQAMSEELASEIESIEKRIFFLAGEEFNISSPKQLSMILFHRLGLSPSKKTKTGFSTDMEVLEELAASHDLPGEVLHYRSLSKLKTTYVDVLPSLVNPLTGRLHTSFNQTVTATGRLSSSEPNLQNIPVRGDWGKRIRAAFVAEEGNLILSADYSQIELRILAHLSGDEGLIDAFRNGIDIHTRTASELFDTPIERVTPEMRRTAKTVNFGVIYGISAFGLAGTLNIGRDEADRYITQYFARHPGVKRYIDAVLREARERGYVTTVFGRRRPVPELKSGNRIVRQQGERFAVNSPVQGTAADIIKIAMIRIWRKFIREDLRTRMILQIHDELLFELPRDEKSRVSVIVRQEMEQAGSFSVPLHVDIGSGRTWSEAH
jgi:DNA polymerase-1